MLRILGVTRFSLHASDFLDSFCFSVVYLGCLCCMTMAALNFVIGRSFSIIAIVGRQWRALGM